MIDDQKEQRTQVKVSSFCLLLLLLLLLGSCCRCCPPNVLLEHLHPLGCGTICWYLYSLSRQLRVPCTRLSCTGSCRPRLLNVMRPAQHSQSILQHGLWAHDAAHGLKCGGSNGLAGSVVVQAPCQLMREGLSRSKLWVKHTDWPTAVWNVPRVLTWAWSL